MHEDVSMDIFQPIQKMVNSLPLAKEQRRSVFDIAGYPSWENVVSNMLAFYFSEDEQHGFGRAIFNSLLRLIKQKVKEKNDLEKDKEYFQINEDFENETYFVQREKGNIDILITSQIVQSEKTNWAILIENKVDAYLYNDLERYWNTINARTKIGIVISLHPVDENKLNDLSGKGIVFYNIAHKEMTDEIRNSLIDLYDTCDDRHLLYLKDFIQNIDSHYTNPSMEKEYLLKLQAFQENAATIKKLKTLENQLNSFVGENARDVMSKFRFQPTGMMNVQGKHYYYVSDDASEKSPKHPLCGKFRFYISQNDLFRDGTLYIYFELFDDAVKFSAALKKGVAEANLIEMGPELRESNGGGPQYSYSHIATVSEFNLRADIQQKGLKASLDDVMLRNFFQSEQGFVQKCAELLESLMRTMTIPSTKSYTTP